MSDFILQDLHLKMAEREELLPIAMPKRRVRQDPQIRQQHAHGLEIQLPNGRMPTICGGRHWPHRILIRKSYRTSKEL